MKYRRHHEPQPHPVRDQRKVQFISFCLHCRNKWQAALQERCLERLANAASMGIQNPCVRSKLFQITGCNKRFVFGATIMNGVAPRHSDVSEAGGVLPSGRSTTAQSRARVARRSNSTLLHCTNACIRILGRSARRHLIGAPIARSPSDLDMPKRKSPDGSIVRGATLIRTLHIP